MCKKYSFSVYLRPLLSIIFWYFTSTHSLSSIASLTHNKIMKINKANANCRSIKYALILFLEYLTSDLNI